MGGHPLRRLVGSRLPAAVGRLSYSLYLWHWPVIVFLPLLADRHDLPFLGGKPALVVAMTVLAVVSYRLWEQPIRFRVWRRAPARRVVLAGLAASVVLSAVTVPFLRPPGGFEGRALASVRDLAKPGACPYFARDWPDPARSRACVQRRGERADGRGRRRLARPAVGCRRSRSSPSARTSRSSGRRAAAARPPTSPSTARPTRATSAARARSARRGGATSIPISCARYDPDVVFVATRSHVSPIVAGGRRVEALTSEHRRRWSAAWDWTVRTLGAGGARVVVSEILPTLPQRIPACLADAGKPTVGCDFPVCVDARRQALQRDHPRPAARAPRGSTVFDPVPIGCPDGICHAMDGDVVVHRDDNHLSATYVRSRAGRFAAALARAGADIR